MVIVFGLALDQSAFPFPNDTELGTLYLGPANLLHTLENYLGLSGHRNDTTYLRIEQYRQLIHRHAESASSAFYQASFAADAFATANDLLQRRDELLMAGFSFQAEPNMPERLRVLVELEELLRTAEDINWYPGTADRIKDLIRIIPQRKIPFQAIRCVEPAALLPVVYRRLFRVLEQAGVALSYFEPDPISGDKDLHQFQRLVRGEEPALKLQGDGSLILVKAKRDTDLAAFTAGLVRKNSDFRPTLVLSGGVQVLDNAFIQEGLPSLGLRVTSLSRPPLQLLKLATSFLWAPLDPYHLLEFVSLPEKPLDSDLAYQIAQQVANAPGIQSAGWRSMIAQFFQQLEERYPDEDHPEKGKIKRQYRFWFERKRYGNDQKAPKIEAIQVFSFLETWAREEGQNQKNTYPPLLALAEKARQVRELLETLPEDSLSQLDLERVVRTIYEPAPLLLNEKQQAALPSVLQPHALYGPTESCMWWNFVEQEPDYFFSRWYYEETRYLDRLGVLLDSPRSKNQRLIWQRQQPVLHTQRQLVLLIPEITEGKTVQAHPLQGYLEAGFENLEDVVFNIDQVEEREKLKQFLVLPQAVDLPYIQLGRVAPFIRVPERIPLENREYETYTSLETLLYYPYQWVFKYLLRLRKSPILSIVRESTLMGNLAHRILEFLLQEAGVLEWSRQEVYNWVEEHTNALLQREGAVLLLYGKEPLRIGFIKKMQMAVWALLDSIKSNGWEIVALEKELGGILAGAEIRARADLVLKRGQEYAILDLKWRGISWRKSSIRNLEDLQLTLYAYLHEPVDKWAHTGYYIIERGQLIARNNLAFQEAEPVAPELDTVQTYEMILSRMQKTYEWRLEQISRGEIEVRCAQTATELEEQYDDLLDLLEMKTDDARYDDYRVLINLL